MALSGVDNSDYPPRDSTRTSFDDREYTTVKWCKGLVKSKDPKVKSLRDELDCPLDAIDHGSTIVAREMYGTKTYYQYTHVANTIMLYDLIVSYPPHQRNFHEVIIGDMRQKPRFDIDIDDGHNPFEIIDLVITGIQRVITIPTDNFLVTTSSGYSDNSGKTKFSFHIIIDGWYHTGHLEAEAFYHRVREISDDPTVFAKYVDGGIYKTHQNLRLLFNTKIGDDRSKELPDSFPYLGVNYYHPKVTERNSRGDWIKDKADLRRTLITFCSGCKPMPLYYVAPPKRTLTPTNMDGVDTDVIVNMLCGKLGLKVEELPFTVEEWDGCFLKLKRTQATDCMICDRVHEGGKQDGWIQVTPQGNVKLGCYGKKGTSLYLGKVSIKSDKPQVLLPTNEMDTYSAKSLALFPQFTPTTVRGKPVASRHFLVKTRQDNIELDPKIRNYQELILEFEKLKPITQDGEVYNLYIMNICRKEFDVHTIFEEIQLDVTKDKTNFIRPIVHNKAYDEWVEILDAMDTGPTIQAPATPTPLVVRSPHEVPSMHAVPIPQPAVQSIVVPAPKSRGKKPGKQMGYEDAEATISKFKNANGIHCNRILFAYPGAINPDNYRRWWRDNQPASYREAQVWNTYGKDKTCSFVFIQCLSQMKKTLHGMTYTEKRGDDVIKIAPSWMKSVLRQYINAVAVYMTFFDKDSSRQANELSNADNVRITQIDRLMDADSFEDAARGCRSYQDIKACREEWMRTHPGETPTIAKSDMVELKHPYQIAVEKIHLSPLPETKLGLSNNRTASFLVDKKGWAGKSTLCAYMDIYYGKDVAIQKCSGTASNLSQLIDKKINAGWTGKTLLLDLPRACTYTSGLFEQIECLLDGTMDKTKYEAGEVPIPKGMKVVVLCNAFPTPENMSKLSEKRLKIINLWERWTTDENTKELGKVRYGDDNCRIGTCKYIDVKLYNKSRSAPSDLDKIWEAIDENKPEIPKVIAYKKEPKPRVDYSKRVHTGASTSSGLSGV